MSAPADWTPHRRDDGELVGWIRPEGDAWVPVDLLGREVAGPIEWLDAEAALEERGIAWLGGAWGLDRDGGGPTLRVRLVEVNTRRVVVQTDDYGAIDVPVERFELPWPAPDALRPWREGERPPPPFSATA